MVGPIREVYDWVLLGLGLGSVAVTGTVVAWLSCTRGVRLLPPDNLPGVSPAPSQHALEALPPPSKPSSPLLSPLPSPPHLSRLDPPPSYPDFATPGSLGDYSEMEEEPGRRHARHSTFV